MSHVSADDITRAFRQLGVRPGDLLIVHGSLSSFGHVEGGADVGGGGAGGERFARRHGVRPDVHVREGAVRPRRQPLVRRGDHGSRPAVPRRDAEPAPDAFVGRRGAGRARTSLPATSTTTPFGPGSPPWRLWERDAKVLLIGVDHRANSMIHVAEESLRLPYLDRTRVAQVVRPDGTPEEVVVRRPGCSAGFSKLDAPLRAAGACARGARRRRRADADASPRRGLGRGWVAQS